jgi:hypothetical protein
MSDPLDRALRKLTWYFVTLTVLLGLTAGYSHEAYAGLCTSAIATGLLAQLAVAWVDALAGRVTLATDVRKAEP